jgi:hypothetical protein
VAAALKERIVFGEVQGQMLSAADMVLALLGVKPQFVEGPVAGGVTTYARATVPSAALKKAAADAADFVVRFRRLPAEVFVRTERARFRWCAGMWRSTGTLRQTEGGRLTG